MNLTKVSKYIALILRHKPEEIGITLDKNGWANVDDLIKGINKTHKLDMKMLEEIVSTDEKQRYSFNEDKTTDFPAYRRLLCVHAGMPDIPYRHPSNASTLP